MTLPEHAVPEDLVSNVEELSRIGRRTTTDGERRSAIWVVEHLEQAGAQEVELLRFRGPSTWAWANGAHAAAGIVAAVIGGPLGSALALGTLISYEADYTGRSQWLRRLVPAGTGTSVVARLPARGPRHRTLVLVAHHDAAHGGWIWHPRALALNRWVARRTGSTPSYAGPAYAALLAVASGLGPARLAGGVFLGLGLLLAAQAAASPTAPGANDNATGVAAVLELVGELAAERAEGIEVIVVCPGGEEVGIAGMLAWVRERARRLNRATTLVLGLDALGAGEPVIVKRESFTATYGRAELRLADAGADRAGLARPQHVGFAVNTDPMAARHAGLPALSILSMKDGGMGHFHQPDDTVSNVDWGSVQRCLRLARGVIETWATPSSAPPTSGGEASELLAAPPG